MTASSPRRSPDPVRQQLMEVRRGLLRLHKALIDSERQVYELRNGAMSNGQFLQALIQNSHFAWLRPYSSLIVAIDEAAADREGVAPDQARAYVVQIRGLVDSEGDPTGRLEQARERDSEVLRAYRELQRLLEATSL